MSTNTIAIDNDNNAVSAIDNGEVSEVVSVSLVRNGCDDRHDRDDKIDATQFAYGPLEWCPNRGRYVHSRVLFKGVSQ